MSLKLVQMNGESGLLSLKTCQNSFILALLFSNLQEYFIVTSLTFQVSFLRSLSSVVFPFCLYEHPSTQLCKVFSLYSVSVSTNPESGLQSL